MKGEEQGGGEKLLDNGSSRKSIGCVQGGSWGRRFHEYPGNRCEAGRVPDGPVYPQRVTCAQHRAIQTEWGRTTLRNCLADFGSTPWVPSRKVKRKARPAQDQAGDMWMFGFYQA